MRILSLVLALLVITACEPKPSEEAAKPASDNAIAPEVRVTNQALKEEPKPEEPEALIQFDGTPHDEEHATVELKWKAEPGSVSLHELPAITSKGAGEFEAKKGMKLEFEDTVVVVTKPNILKAKKDAVLHGASLYDPMTKTSGDDIKLEVPLGDEVGVLKYAGEGTCFVSVADKVYSAGCPDPQMFEGDTKKNGPVESQWWVRPKGAEGWLKVDERVDVKVGSTIK